MRNNTMSISDVRAAQIGQIVESVWQQVLDLPIEGELPVDEAAQTPDISVCVHITGAWNGAVVLSLNERFATHAAARLFAIGDANVTWADIQDGMAELGHIIAGNLKSLLPGPSALSLPTVARGYQHQLSVRRTKVVADYSFTSGHQPLRVVVLEGMVPLSA
jgi:chemotaxis protein CheX